MTDLEQRTDLGYREWCPHETTFRRPHRSPESPGVIPMSILEVDRPESKVLVLGPGLAGTLMTPEEFDHAEEADRSFTYELIRGVLVVAPPPLEDERGPNEELGFQLRLYKTQHPQGSALDDTLPEQHVPTSGNRRRADRVIWTGLGRVPHPLTDMPTIVAEFVSEGRRNRHRDYIRNARSISPRGFASTGSSIALKERSPRAVLTART